MIIPTTLITTIREFLKSPNLKNLAVTTKTDIPSNQMKRYGFNLRDNFWVISRQDAINLYHVYLSNVKSTMSIFSADVIRHKLIQDELDKVSKE